MEDGVDLKSSQHRKGCAGCVRRCPGIKHPVTYTSAAAETTLINFSTATNCILRIDVISPSARWPVLALSAVSPMFTALAVADHRVIGGGDRFLAATVARAPNGPTARF